MREIATRVTVKPLVDAMARIPAVMRHFSPFCFKHEYTTYLGHVTVRVPRGSFGGFDPSIQRMVIMLPKVT